MKEVDITNQRFGSLVAKSCGIVNHKRKWLCRCDCGNTVLVSAGNLRCGNNTSCGCRLNARRKLSKGGCGGITGNVWRRIIDTAKQRKGIKSEFTVTIEEAWELFLRQNGKCAISGLDLYLPKNGKEYHEDKKTASLDRIDSSKGYISGNVQWLHKDINRLKNDFSEDKFLDLCRVIVDYNRKSGRIK